MKTLRISVDQISEYSYLEFGERGENAVTEVILDFSAWVEEFGEGIVNLYVKRSGDTSAYPVPLSVEGTVATWIVSDTDTYKRGRGEAEYVYVVGEKVEKTAVFGFYVNRDIGQPATTPPSPYETWLETLMELSNTTIQNAQDAEESADKAETASQHYPVIVDNYWWVWRVEEEAYVNTGVKAEGEDFTIKGTVATVADLPSEAKQGDFWNVGTEAPYTMYMYQVGEGWINQGTLQGPTGTTFTPSVSEEGIISWTNDGGKPNPASRNIRGPQGIQGEKGDTGDAAGFGTPVASADQTIGQASVSVTASGPNTAKVFDFKFSGIKGEHGEVGPTGTTFTPQVSSAGVISWTNDGGKQNPESVNIKGPQGEQGVKGDTGAAAGFGTPTASATQTVGEAAVEVTATGPDTAKVFDFRFSGIKGEKGDKGDKGDTGEVTQAEFDELAGEVSNQKSAIEALDSLVDRKAGMLVDTASGSIASFVPDSTIPDLLGVTVDIEPVQAGSGDPSPDNVRPISGWDSVEVDATGINIFDDATLVELGGVKQEDGSVYFANANLIYNKLIWDNPKNYSGPIAITLLRKVDSSSSTGRLVVNYSDGTLDYVGRDTDPANEWTTYTLITPSTKSVLSITGTYGTNRGFYWKVQIELGNTLTAYKPFAGNRYTIQLGDTVYGGDIGVVSGNGESTMGMVDMGTLEWTYDASRERFRGVLPATSSASTSNPGARTHCLCSIYKPSALAYNDSNRTYMVVCVNTDYAWLRDNRYTDAATFKAAMSGVQLCYELATPIEIQFDPVTISTIPGQTNNVWADAGDVDVTYAADIKAYIDRLNQPTEDDMIANSLIASGKYFTINNRLFLSTASIAAGAQIIPGTNCTETSLAAALNALNA